MQLIELDRFEPIYQYQMSLCAPYFFPVSFPLWEKSFLHDIDGEGRTLFRSLFVKAVYEENALIGFIQYGETAFGFDTSGESSPDVSYCVIRNFYFDQDRLEAGELLLNDAMEYFGATEQVYAFFHYFGMSCFARHGKLFEEYCHVEEALNHYGFQIEHENVYYSSVLAGSEHSGVELIPHSLTKGKQQYIDFILSGTQVGGCELHYVDPKTAYLRWIYVNDTLTGRGIGSSCINTLRWWLYHDNGITRFDTDTALSNRVAQHFYEKNGFTREGITRSYYRL